MRIVTGHDKAVADWMGANMGVQFAQPYTAIGVVNADGTLIGGAVFNCFMGTDIEVSVYGCGGAFSRSALRFGFEYIFGQLKCDRATARVDRDNHVMRQLMRRLGFKREGLQRGRYDRGRVLYGMLRDECRWLERAR